MKIDHEKPILQQNIFWILIHLFEITRNTVEKKILKPYFKAVLKEK